MSIDTWAVIWAIVLILVLVVFAGVSVGIAIGGFRDIKAMFSTLDEEHADSDSEARARTEEEAT